MNGYKGINSNLWKEFDLEDKNIIFQGSTLKIEYLHFVGRIVGCGVIIHMSSGIVQYYRDVDGI